MYFSQNFIFFYFYEILYRFFYLCFSFLLCFFLCFFKKGLLFYFFIKPLFSVMFSLSFNFIFLMPSDLFYVTVLLSIFFSFLFVIPFFWVQVWFNFSNSFKRYEQFIFKNGVIISVVCFFLFLFFVFKVFFPIFWSFFFLFTKKINIAGVLSFDYFPTLYPYILFSVSVFKLVFIFSQLPFIVYLGVTNGFFSMKDIAFSKKFFYFCFSFIATVFSSPDFMNQILMLMFIILFFEFGFFVCCLYKMFFK